MNIWKPGRKVAALERRIVILEQEVVDVRAFSEDAEEIFRSIATELQDLRNGITKQPEAEPARKAVRVSWRRFAALKTQQTREQLEGAAQ